MAALYPLKLSYVVKSPIWSGEKLKTGWSKRADGAIGESWELSVRKSERSKVLNGAFAGCTLYELIERFGADITGKSSSPADFPLLIKLIDAADDLSVQVHPDDEYAARVENDRGKTEMWYIVEANEGAQIVYGLREGADAHALADAVERGDVASALNFVTVHAGETYFIPAGLLHAIGKGILIAEVQQNCDLTYRVYDYGRLGADGKPRELHTEKALEVTRVFSDAEIDAIRYSRASGEHSESLLADCDFFRVERLTLTGGEERAIENGGRFCHILVLGGSGAITHGGASYPFSKGDSYFIPASLCGVGAIGDTSLLISFSAD